MKDNTVYLDENFEITDISTEIEIDEKIVDIIIALNKKGYKTIECCSGHYDERIYYDFDFSKTLSSLEDLEWLEENLLEIISEDEKKYYCRGKNKGSNFCVFFDEQIFLPFYPEGFERRGNSVWCEIDFYNDLGTFMNRKSKEEIEKEIETIHSNIRKWVEKLPEISKSKLNK